MAIALRYAARTDLGLGPKSRNEDSGYAGPQLLVLADGMGGHAAGDVASSLIVGQLAPLDSEGIGADQALGRLEESVHDANAELRRAMQEDPALAGMGSTTIAMLRSGTKMAMAHIGDSRAYLLRDGSLTQITKDHSYVQQLVDQERITPEEALDHPQRSLVTRVMTGQPDDEPDLSMRELRVGDRYLLCSDGLSDFVRHDILEEILLEAQSPSVAADRLIDVALKASARDNVTVVVADVVDLESEPAPSSAPQIVGAASVRDREGKRTRGIPLSPAEKAASLVRSIRHPTGGGSGGDDPSSGGTGGHDDGDEPEAPTLAEQARTRRARWGRRLLVVAVVLVVLVGGAYAGWSWTQRQLFIGDSDGYVAVYQGVPQKVGPLELSTVQSQTEIPVDSLPVIYQDLVRAGVVVDSHDDADARIAGLRNTALSCRLQAAAGNPCGGNPVTPIPTVTVTVPPTPDPTAPPATPAAPTTPTTTAPTP